MFTCSQIIRTVSIIPFISAVPAHRLDTTKSVHVFSHPNFLLFQNFTPGLAAMFYIQLRTWQIVRRGIGILPPLFCVYPYDDISTWRAGRTLVLLHLCIGIYNSYSSTSDCSPMLLSLRQGSRAYSLCLREAELIHASEVLRKSLQPSCIGSGNSRRSTPLLLFCFGTAIRSSWDDQSAPSVL